MGLFSSLASFFRRKPAESSGRSFFTFQNTGEVILAERYLREAGFQVEAMGPPEWIRTGCDMVLVSDGIQEVGIRRTLEEKNLTPEQVHPVSSTMLTPVSLFSVSDFGDWYMVRAANMKITVAKATGIIVNVSGGGCPDVPYLAGLLLGQSIEQAADPRLEGKTLCSYALQKAFEEARRFWRTELHGSS